MTDPATGGETVTKREAGRARRVAAVTVDEVLCKRCGLCIDLCPRSVFERGSGGLPEVARLGDCTACRFCEQHCPDFAIDVEPAAGTEPREGDGVGA
jgi:2-oxoglutarate ferredoxin oxidoreductase subunit delta